ncbi:UNVERIFIED_CONTAM: hypothetical protein K2H54_038523 [Gekko kuhli]
MNYPPPPPPPQQYQQQQQQLAHSAAIRAEIGRFESVHPNIYSIYELLERVEEPALQGQIREHVIAIEGKPRPRPSPPRQPCEVDPGGEGSPGGGRTGSSRALQNGPQGLPADPGENRAVTSIEECSGDVIYLRERLSLPVSKPVLKFLTSRVRPKGQLLRKAICGSRSEEPCGE